MSTNEINASPGLSANPNRCRLLELPIELQITIYELAVLQYEPLLLNCACNSSYSQRRMQMREDEEAWDTGKARPPLQPALSQTCRSIRELALPLFYSENIFRASYCDPIDRPTMLPSPIKWLRLIGKENRERLRHLYFYDRNPLQDRYKPYRLEALKGCKIFSGMNGKIETFDTYPYCCAHLVTFGDWQRKADEVPLAAEENPNVGVKRLHMAGESYASN